jgi:hypothetical protein
VIEVEVGVDEEADCLSVGTEGYKPSRDLIFEIRPLSQGGQTSI